MNRSSILQTILSEHWASVKPLLVERLPAPVAAAAEQAVQKALVCGTEAMGYVRYRCADCEALHTVCFTCKSRFCPSCGKARAAEAAVQAQGRLLNVQHRHLTFSVPAELRPLLFEDRSLLSVVAKAAAQATLHAVGTRCKKCPPLPGIMATVHTFGRDLGFHVHVHVLCTEGGLREDNVWQPVHLFPAQQYRRLWQYYLLKGLRKRLKGNRAAQWRIGRLYRKYPAGFIVNVMSRYRSGRKAAAYCCRYTGRPAISERRILSYDGETVTICYKDYRDGLDKTLTLSAVEFVLRLVQHVWPRYQRDVHYYGLYQPSRRKQHTTEVAQASRYGDQVRPIFPKSRRERLIEALAGRFIECPACGGTLGIESIQFPEKHYVTRSKGPPRRKGGQLSLPM